MTTTQITGNKTSVAKEVGMIRAFAKKASTDKAAARRFLISTGIYTKQGKLSALYR